MTATQRCTEMEGRRRWLRLSAGLKELLPGHWRISSFEPRNIGCVLPGTFRWRIYLLGCDTQRVGNQRAYLLCLLLIWLGQKACSTLARPYPAYCIRYHKFTTGNCCHATPPLSLSLPRQSQAAYRCYSLHLEVYAARDIVISVGFKHGTHTVGVYLVQSTTDTAWSQLSNGTHIFTCT